MHQAQGKETVGHLNATITTKAIMVVVVVTEVEATTAKTETRTVRETITKQMGMVVEVEILMPLKGPKRPNSSSPAKRIQKTNGTTRASMRSKMSRYRSQIDSSASSMTSRREGKVKVVSNTKDSQATAVKVAKKLVMEVMPTLNIIRLVRSRAITFSNRLSSNNNRIFTRKTEMKNLNKISNIKMVSHSNRSLS